MELEKVINSVRSEVAKRFDFKTDVEIDAFFIGAEESAKNNQEALEKRDKMLRDTVAELCEAKRLLKVAVEGYNFIGHITKDYACPSAISCSACPMDEGKQCRIWEHADEALALIGEGGDTND